METENIEDYTKQLSEVIRDANAKFEEAKANVDKLKPTGSRRVVIDGMDAVVTINASNNIGLEFDDPKNGLIYYNSLKLKN